MKILQFDPANGTIGEQAEAFLVGNPNFRAVNVAPVTTPIGKINYLITFVEQNDSIILNNYQFATPAVPATAVAQVAALHKDTHISGGTDAFEDTDLLEALVKRIQAAGPIDLTIGTIADLDILTREGTVVKGIARSSIGGGPPGSWSQEAKGPTAVLDDVTTDLATLSVADGEVLFVPPPISRSDLVLSIVSGDTSSSPGAGKAFYSLDKTATADEVLFKFRHKAGETVTFDWVVYKVLPV